MMGKMAGPLVQRKSVNSASAESRKSHGRSRITNGNGVLLPDIDGRSCIARRYRDVVSAILIDQGGADRCPESRTQLIRRFAAAAVLAEQLEARLANGEAIDIAEHATLSSTLVRLAQRIGIDRVAGDITTFGQLMAADIEEVALTASDRALLEQAARLLARRMRDEEVAVKATNAARHIIDGLRERYKPTPGSVTAPSPWSPLRSQAATDADEVTP
jgi:hypothetical protein